VRKGNKDAQIRNEKHPSTGERVHSRLVGVTLNGNMPSALWALKFSYLFDKREEIPFFSFF